MATYIALLRKDAASDFGVEFPDFAGVVTAGSTLEEARAMASEALAFHIDGMIEDGEPLPAPSTLDVINDLHDMDGAVAFLVTVPDRAPKVLRVNITLTEPTLARLDAFAESQGLTRSALIARATENLMLIDEMSRQTSHVKTIIGPVGNMSLSTRAEPMTGARSRKGSRKKSSAAV